MSFEDLWIPTPQMYFDDLSLNMRLVSEPSPAANEELLRIHREIFGDLAINHTDRDAALRRGYKDLVVSDGVVHSLVNARVSSMYYLDDHVKYEVRYEGSLYIDDSLIVKDTINDLYLPKDSPSGWVKIFREVYSFSEKKRLRHVQDVKQRVYTKQGFEKMAGV